MFLLKTKMYLLIIAMFAIVYAIVSMIAASMGVGSFTFYLILSLVIMSIQYMVGPKLVEWSMRVKYLEPHQHPELHQMVSELSQLARIPKPRLGIANIPIPNAFAFGRWSSDGRVCVTEGILRLLSKEELRAVLGHEISHLKNRDVLTITVLSVIPLLLYRIAFHFLFFGGFSRRRRGGGGNVVLLGLAALIFYFITNLLVLYASRIREYFADRGSVALGNSAHSLASALYKLVYGNARVSKEATREVEGLKAFFVNDPSRAFNELNELKQIDTDHSGTIDQDELSAVRSKELRLSTGDKLMEIFSTHPNMLKRIKSLSEYDRP